MTPFEFWDELDICKKIDFEYMRMYCLPILTYAAPALNLCDKQLREVNVCWNGVYRKIFKFHQWESVKSLIHGIGRSHIIHILAFRKLQYFCRLEHSVNVRLLCVMFYSVLN